MFEWGFSLPILPRGEFSDGEFAAALNNASGDAGGATTPAAICAALEARAWAHCPQFDPTGSAEGGFGEVGRLWGRAGVAS